ncbi:hypothetical protein ABI_08770 [Asticcacaulis biprosthecium C19]|uniref:Uncharacterized protein n=1 Tax=Asticcacaulis biprosthecium C19 TaxID=715226 RepID=F4QGB3_9CAUL|nr:hypothetical protein [Asticcacaulis biprosthecium]EGF92441.1 hypothetical protein ABI_08770 [Asticcacaulis biprosthecium C19]
MRDLLPFIAIFVSLAAFVMNVATFIRAGKWKESEEGKLLIARVERAEKWSEHEIARALLSTVAEHETRLAAGEIKFLNLATKADIASVKAEVSALEKTIDKVDGAVVRIERLLMGRHHD